MTGALRRAAKNRISEGVRIDSLPLRTRLLLYAAYPGKATRYFSIRLRQWTTLPGDTWYDLLPDRYYVVTTVKPRHIKAEVYARQMLHRPDLLAQARVDVASIKRADMETWWPA